MVGSKFKLEVGDSWKWIQSIKKHDSKNKKTRLIVILFMKLTLPL
jgi:hypothetical protein